MTQSSFVRPLLAVLAAGLAAGCTMQKQERPGFAGPSEFGTSIVIAVTPDILTQDGFSQSVVTVTARGPNGQPLGGVPLRAEILVNGTAADFGSLSARNLVTGPDGRATVTFTAPPAPPVAVDEFTVVDIGITPIGSDFGNSVTRFASVRLVPPGLIAPPSGLRPAFTVTPSAPQDNQTVLFDASTSQAPGNNPIVGYAWDFGDGRTAAGVVTSHQFGAPGTYVVRLTVTDGLGRTASASQSVTVSAGAVPAAVFSFSPTPVTTATIVNFNAAASTAAPGRVIRFYRWNFGCNAGVNCEVATADGAIASTRYTVAGVYTVTLTVTDDAGRSHTTTQSITVL